MRVKITLAGAKRTRAVLETKERNAKRATRAGLVTWADLAAQTMRSLVPVRLGRLRDAIRVDSVERTPWGFSAFVGPGDRERYAPHVEYGTKNTPEQPYARPTSLVASQFGAREITKAVRRRL